MMHVRRLKNGIASVQQIGGTVPFGAVGRVRRLVFLSLFFMVCLRRPALGHEHELASTIALQRVQRT